MSENILVTGIIDLDPAKHDAAVASFTGLMTPTLGEDGCEHYSFSADLNDPGRFHLSERWTSQEAMDTHMAAPHFVAFMGSAGELGITGFTATKWVGASAEKLM